MSKSMGNYIGLQEEARVMFKKVMEIPDSLIVKYFALATDILPQQLEEIKNALESGSNPRDYKLLLARTITALYHSAGETKGAEEYFRQAFTDKGIPKDIPRLQLLTDSCPLQKVIPLLVEENIVAGSNEFRRLLSQNGVRLNGEKLSDLDREVHDGDVLKIGKKRFVRLCVKEKSGDV